MDTSPASRAAASSASDPPGSQPDGHDNQPRKTVVESQEAPLFDILVYLFERYIHADACPESEQLARKLSAAGFEDEEITEAMDWLSGLRRILGSTQPGISPAGATLRLYTDDECLRLNTECRGFLSFLDHAGVLDTTSREVIVESAMALDEGFVITLNRLKLVVLMVLWQQEQPLDMLLVDELLNADDEDFQPVLH